MRNYENETAWRKKRYDLIKAYIEKDLGTKLRLKLKKQNKTMASWVRDNAKKYIEE